MPSADTSTSTAFKTIRGSKRTTRVCNRLLPADYTRKEGTCASSLASCVSTKDARLQALIRPSTPRGYGYPNRTDTPRSTFPLYGGSATPATVPFQAPARSPAPDAMTPPHLPATCQSLDVAYTIGGASIVAPASKALGAWEPAIRECLGDETVDEGRILPPHLPSTNNAAALTGPHRQLLSPVSARQPVSPPSKEHLVPVPHLSSLDASQMSPAQNTMDCTALRRICAVRSRDLQPSEVLMTSPSDRTLQTAMPTTPLAPAPSPEVQHQPALPHARSFISMESAAITKLESDRLRNLLSLGSSDMDRLCMHLGHLSTQRAPSAPPGRSQPCPGSMLQERLGMRALSCSPPRVAAPGSLLSQVPQDATAGLCTAEPRGRVPARYRHSGFRRLTYP